MVDAGIFGEDDRVELVQGEILEVTPQGPEHRTLKDELHERLADAYRGRDAHVLNQGPLRAGPEGLPEPDLAVIRGARRDYLKRHPGGADALLVVEIAKTSQERDRAKAVDYARGGVPIYWLLDLEARTLDVFSEPDAERGRYRRLASLGEADEVALPNLDVRWRVGSLLP
jgi:Uma2 family endonuclease